MTSIGSTREALRAGPQLAAAARAANSTDTAASVTGSVGQIFAALGFTLLLMYLVLVIQSGRSSIPSPT